MLFLYPLRDYHSNWEIHDFSYYNIGFACGFMNDFIPTIFYNVLPTDMATPICATFIYSLIFAYYMISIKEKYNNKYYLLFAIPFCFPFFLLQNISISRFIYATWLFIFVSLFFVFNKQKNISNTKIAIGFGIILSLLSDSRPEFCLLIIFFPILFLIFKIFSIKNLLILISSSILLFSTICIINKSFNKEFYEVHNLSFIYIHSKSNPNVIITKEEIDILKKVYLGIEKEPFNDSSFFNDLKLNVKSNNIMAMKTLIFIALKNYPHYFYTKIRMIDDGTKNIQDIFDSCVLKIRLTDKKNEKLISYLLYGTENFSLNKFYKIFYHPVLYYFLLLFIFVAGIIKRKYEYSALSLIWIIIAIITLFACPFYRFLYFLPMICNTLVILFLFFSENKKFCIDKK